MVGLNIVYSVGNLMYEELKREEYAPPPLLRRMVAAGAQPEVRTRFLRVRQVAPPTAGDTYRATVVDRDLLARKPRLAGYLTPDRTGAGRQQDTRTRDAGIR